MDGYVHPSNGKISNVDCSGNDFPGGDSYNNKPMEALMVHKWQSRIEYKVKFLFDDPKGPYKSNYGGDDWMYTVSIDGDETVFYASHTLKTEIEKYGCRKDGVYYICKAEAEDGSWIGWLIGDDPMDEFDEMRFQKRQIEMSERTPAPSRPKNTQNTNHNDTDLKILRGMAFNNTTRLVCSMPFHADETPEDRIKLIAELTPKMLEIARSMSTTSKPDDDPLF